MTGPLNEESRLAWKAVGRTKPIDFAPEERSGIIRLLFAFEEGKAVVVSTDLLRRLMLCIDSDRVGNYAGYYESHPSLCDCNDAKAAGVDVSKHDERCAPHQLSILLGEATE